MNPEDKEQELEKEIKKQNTMTLLLGIMTFLIILVVCYFFRDAKSPLPSPFSLSCQE